MSEPFEAKPKKAWKAWKVFLIILVIGVINLIARAILFDVIFWSDFIVSIITGPVVFTLALIGLNRIIREYRKEDKQEGLK